MKITTKEQHLQKLRDNNEAFKTLSLPEKRVQVAKDILEQIKVGFLDPSRGRWLTFDGLKQRGKHINPLYHKIYTTKSVQAVVNKNCFDRCLACALGSLMLSCTLHNNETQFGDTSLTNIGGSILHNKLSNGLNTIFSNRQLQLIELAFELGFGYFKADNYTDMNDKTRYWSAAQKKENNVAILFGSKYSTDKKRLVAIMRNIVTNKGLFVPQC